jgi:hypothetical protein
MNGADAGIAARSASNFTLHRTAGSHALAAAGERGRYAHSGRSIA